MRILVTGAAGFIGSHLSEALLREGHEVAGLDDFNDYYDPAVKRRNVDAVRAAGPVRLYEGDLRDEALVERSFAEFRPEVLVHLAARAGVRPSLVDPALYLSVNVAGTIGLFEVCVRHACRRVLSASSSSVYGDAARVPFREDDGPLAPISPYGVTKLVGEHYARVYHLHRGLDVLAFRFFTVYGPRQRPDMAIHKFIRGIAAGRPIDVYGDGTTRRDYTYVDDIVKGLLAAVRGPGGFEVINLGESRTVPLAELLAVIERAVGRKAVVNRLPEQPGDVKRTYADVSKARKLLGYEPSIPIEEGIRRTVEWFRKENLV